MNRLRLENLRDAIRGLNAIEPRQSPGHNEVVTDDGVLTHSPERIATIDTLDMGTYHSEDRNGNECRTLGCIAGMAIKLHTEEARDIAMAADKGAAVRPGPADVAQRILGLSATESTALFSSVPLGERIQNPVTPAEAAAAIDRMLTGVNPWNIWNDTNACGHPETAG